MIPFVSPFGDRAVHVSWPGEGYSEAASDHALGLAAHLRGLGRFSEVMPGYADVIVAFDPSRLDLEDALYLINSELPKAPISAPQGRTVDIPVRYGGPDMDAICASSGMSATEVVALHSADAYRVCMLGFVPGFAFLSEVPSVLAHPRHSTPRETVRAGSVGIAGWQTGIYGLDSPGGWQIIGHTDAVMFDPDRTQPCLVQAGDRVRFVPL